MHRSFSFFTFFAGLILAVFLALPSSAGAQISSASADFQRQVVVAWGLAGAPWEKSPSIEEERSRAWMDAMHHAYEAILAMPLMEQATVKGAILQNPALRERLGRLLLSIPPTFFEPDVSGLYRCRLEVPFAGRDSLRSALYLATLRPSAIEPRGFVASESVSSRAANGHAETAEATGTAPLRLVLDLRRTAFAPSLFPRFYSEEGRLLFQEAMIPVVERFHRPAVRFTKAIDDAAAGIVSERVRYVEAQVPTLARHDVQVRKADEELFRRFCRGLIDSPLREGELLIVYGTNLLPAGVLPKVEKKDKAEPGGAAKTKDPGTKTRKRR